MNPYLTDSSTYAKLTLTDFLIQINAKANQYKILVCSLH